MPERPKSLVFPIRGLNRRFGIQKPPEFTTPDCLNVRPFDPLEERQRGGNRPGLARYNLGASNGKPVNLLSSISLLNEEGASPASFFDDFTSGLDSTWELFGLRRRPGLGVMRERNAVSGVCHRPFPEGFNRNLEWSVSLTLKTVLVEDAFQEVLEGWVYIDLGVASNGLAPDGPWTRIELVGRFIPVLRRQELLLSLVHFEGQFEARRPWSLGVALSRSSMRDVTLTARVIGDTVVISVTSVAQVYNLDSVAALPLTPLTGPHLGFTLQQGPASQQGVTELADSPIALSFEMRYQAVEPAVFPSPGNALVGASDGSLIIKLADGTTQRASGGLAQLKRPLMAVDAIAPIAPAGDGENEPTPERAPGIRLFIADYGGDEVLPKVYDPVLNKLEDWKADIYGSEAASDEVGSPKGTVPPGNHIIARFQGRVYLAGNPPHVWYAARVDDPFDWDQGKGFAEGGEDPFSAVAGPGQANAGDISEPITALAPFTDDYMIFGTANSLFRQAGDPGLNVPLLNISSQAGIAGPQAWCMTPEGAMVFLDQERGLFLLGPGGRSFPVALSAEVLPRELRDIDTRDVVVFLAYDHRQPGVHIMLKSAAGRTLDHWWFDRRAPGFWPFTLDSRHLPSSVYSYQSTNPALSGVLLGGADGFVRRFENPDPVDDGQPFPQHVVYGPFNLAGGDYLEGVLKWIRATLPTSGSGLTYQVFTGPTAEDALNDNSEHQRVFTGRFGSNPLERKTVRLRGVVAFVKIFGGSSAWAVETVDVMTEALTVARA